MVAFVNGNGLRPGYVIKIKGDLYRVMSAEHRTPGKGRAFMQAKLRKLQDGTQTEIKFRADETIERAEMEQVEMEYLYDDPSGLCFMNCETYEQMFLNEKVMGDGKKFLVQCPGDDRILCRQPHRRVFPRDRGSQSDRYRTASERSYCFRIRKTRNA